MRYARVTRLTFSLSALCSVPLIVPRAVCGCQPVRAVSCSIVPPADVRGMAISWNRLEPVGGTPTTRAVPARLAGGRRLTAALGSAGLDCRASACPGGGLRAHGILLVEPPLHCGEYTSDALFGARIKSILRRSTTLHT